MFFNCRSQIEEDRWTVAKQNGISMLAHNSSTSVWSFGVWHIQSGRCLKRFSHLYIYMIIYIYVWYTYLGWSKMTFICLGCVEITNWHFFFSVFPFYCLRKGAQRELSMAGTWQFSIPRCWWITSLTLTRWHVDPKLISMRQLTMVKSFNDCTHGKLQHG